MLHAMFGLRPALLVPVGLALALGCGGDTPGTAFDLTGTVSAQLTDTGNSMPLAGATVRFTSDTGHVTETTSAGDGSYAMQVFTDVPFGQVRAEAAGFGPSEATVYFDLPERRIDLTLRPMP
jgi:hypothetical protein